MNDEDGFLKAIAEQPAERSTRLVYADWLDENGRPREAEFLRLQIQAAELSAKLGELDAKWLATVGNVPVNQSELKLRSGRTIRLQELRQYRVYEGLLEGLPTRERNQQHLDRLRTSHPQAHIIEPEQRAIHYSGDRPYPFGTPAALPGIECVGRFDSLGAVRGENGDGSQLTIIWFQGEFAFPIDLGVREQLLALDWEKLAHNYEW